MKYCPECEKYKVYLSNANMNVCRACGVIFKPLTSEQHLQIAIVINQQDKLIEAYKKLQDLHNDTINIQRKLILKLKAKK